MTARSPHRALERAWLTAWRVRIWTSQSGQAMAEYASTTSILLLIGLAIGTSSSVVPAFFKALQGYVDLMFYALNVAVG